MPAKPVPLLRGVSSEHKAKQARAGFHARGKTTRFSAGFHHAQSQSRIPAPLMPVDRGEDAAFYAEAVEVGTGEYTRRVLGVFADEGYALCSVVNIHPFYEQGRFNRYHKDSRTAPFVNREEHNISVIETGAGH